MQILFQVLRVSNRLEIASEQFLFGVAGDFTETPVDAKPTAIEGFMGDSHGGLIERRLELFLPLPVHLLQPRILHGGPQSFAGIAH